MIVRVHLPVTSPDTSAFPKVQQVGFPQRAVQRRPNGMVLSRLQSFVNLQTSEFACHPGRSYRQASLPMLRAAVARLHLSRTRVITFACIRYASRPNRAIDGPGLSPVRFAALPAAPALAPFTPWRFPPAHATLLSSKPAKRLNKAVA